MPTIQQLQKSLTKCDKARRYAWAQYFELQRENHEEQLQQVVVMRRVVEVQSELPEMIKREMIEMYEKLKTKVECPICLEVIPTNNLDWSKCGHRYCKQCLTTLKSQPQPKCALCRKPM